MKALSIRAPWAWAIMTAGKDIENRNWETNYRGSLLIHVSKSVQLYEINEAQARTDLWIPPKGQLNLGQVIGVVDLIGCEHSHNRIGQWGKWGQPSQYHWLIANPRPICRFYHKGQLGLFDIPDDLIDFDASKNPILEECGYKSKGSPRGEWRVTVWRHPSKPGFYSYGCSIAGGVAVGGEDATSEDSTLFGCFQTPEQALEGGIKSIYE